MWREWMLKHHPVGETLGGQVSGPEFSPGATEDELADVERSIGARLPASLRALLAETNGIFADYGAHFIYSTDEIIKSNQEMRTAPIYQQNYLPFDYMLFFGAPGVDGIQFAFDARQSEANREDIYAWYPITDDRDWKAPSLKAFIEGWGTGKISV